MPDRQDFPDGRLRAPARICGKSGRVDDDAGGSEHQNRRLGSWKEIAAFLIRTRALSAGGKKTAACPCIGCRAAPEQRCSPIPTSWRVGSSDRRTSRPSRSRSSPPGARRRRARSRSHDAGEAWRKWRVPAAIAALALAGVALLLFAAGQSRGHPRHCSVAAPQHDRRQQAGLSRTGHDGRTHHGSCPHKFLAGRLAHVGSTIRRYKQIPVDDRRRARRGRHSRRIGHADGERHPGERAASGRAARPAYLGRRPRTRHGRRHVHATGIGGRDRRPDRRAIDAFRKAVFRRPARGIAGVVRRLSAGPLLLEQANPGRTEQGRNVFQGRGDSRYGESAGLCGSRRYVSAGQPLQQHGRFRHA